MAEDIVERLRKWEDRHGNVTPGELMDEAAAEIARLREERRQREALWTACADKTQLVYGGAFRPKPLPTGPEGSG